MKKLNVYLQGFAEIAENPPRLVSAPGGWGVATCGAPAPDLPGQAVCTTLIVPVRENPQDMGDANSDTPTINERSDSQDEQATVAPHRPRRLELWLPFVIVALDQLTKAIVRSQLTMNSSVTILTGLRQSHPRAKHRRGVRLPQRHRFPAQDRPARCPSPLARWSVSVLYAASLARGPACGAHGPWRSSSAAPPAISSTAWSRGSVVDFVDVYVADASFLGVQRRRLGDYHRRGRS